jgi:putative CocE/NonD family hydrolase
MGDAGKVDMGGGVWLERRVPCRMSDGVTLYSDHYYPPGGGVQPTLLMRQPYGRDIASTVVYAHPAWFARQGYNVVIQDVRGRGDSEGEFYPFRHEGRVGGETFGWMRTRPESNGSVGMYGFSYQGMTQLLAAAEQPEGLVCISPAMTACDLYSGWFYQGGALRLASTLGWGLQMLKEDARRRGLREASDLLERAWANLPAQFLETPYAGHPVFGFEGLPTYLRDWIEHDEPGPYWHDLDVSQKLAKIQIPALHVSGWYDTYLRGSVDGFNAMRGFAKDQYLLAGPWIHIPWGDRIGPLSLGADANLDTDTLLLRWFNHWLKGTGEFAAEPAIRHFA